MCFSNGLHIMHLYGTINSNNFLIAIDELSIMIHIAIIVSHRPSLKFEFSSLEEGRGIHNGLSHNTHSAH